MPTFLDGQQNLAALQVPGVYFDIIPPQPIVTGQPTNVMGLVGVGQWGPVNAPVPFSTPDDCAGTFGVSAVRSRDLATYVTAATKLGQAVAWRGVRVTDGTDVAASATLQTNGGTLTGKYTGSRGNQIRWSIQTGTAANSYAFSVAFPGRAPERWNNIPGATGAAFWANLAAAINTGTTERGPSRYVVFTAGVSTTVPVVAPAAGGSGTLSGGTDGASGVTDAMMIGSDVSPRTGMYALRRTGIDAFALCDMVDSTKWSVMDTFALSETSLAVFTTASGDSITAAVASRITAALDSFNSWLIMGDFPTFYDDIDGINRLVSPAAIGLGLLGNLSPEQSPLNKQLRGVVATQKSQAVQVYSDAEIAIAEQGGIDLIVGPPTSPGGNYFSFITGRNAWSNAGGSGIEYTRLTNFIARSLQTYAAGSFVGKLQSVQANDPTRQNASDMLNSFFAMLASPSMGSGGYGMIDTPWRVQCDLSNNPPALQARGYLFAFCAVRYLNVVRYFVVKFAGGGNVQVTSQAAPPSVTQFA